MRLVVFGANGGTGRLLTRQALDAGHEVVAVTRNAHAFPIEGRRLGIVEADVHNAEAVAKTVVGADAVLSTLGVGFSRKPITTYSVGIDNIIAAMRSNGVTRIVAVTSSAVEPRPYADGGLLMNRVVQPLVTRTIGKTTYTDMRRMEARLEDSELAWTILRPSGLFDTDRVSSYRLQEDHPDGIFTARTDLAAGLLAQASDLEWRHKKVAITTTEGTPTMWQMFRQEPLGAGAQE